MGLDKCEKVLYNTFMKLQKILIQNNWIKSTYQKRDDLYNDSLFVRSQFQQLIDKKIHVPVRLAK